jgi:multidrug efflux system membrane fusion protein
LFFERGFALNFMKTKHLMIGFVLLLSACGKPAPRNASGPPPVPVEVVTAETGVLPVELKAIGTVEPVSTVQLKSKVQGEVMKVHFADGAQVSAGDLLFSIDPRAFEAASKRAEANLAIAQAAAQNATEQAGRYSTLIQRGVASKEQTSQILTAAQSTKAELAARQADLDAARLSLEWTQVTSPVSGRAGAALLKPGNIAQPNVDTLVVINQMQPILVRFALPENSLRTVREAMKTGSPTVRAYDPDSGRPLGSGELNFLDNSVDRASGMITFKATFPNDDESLWPGQFVDVTVKLTEETGIVVPTVAVMEGQQGPQVFVIENDVATLRKVTVGRSMDGRTLISSGLEVGEQIITTGQLRITSGGKVTIRPATPTTPKE